MRTRHAFTLIETLIVIALITVMLGMLLPAVGSVRDSARRAVCMSNQRQLVTAWTLYANDHAGRTMPHLAPGKAQHTYWYGAEDPAQRRVVHARGTLAPYLDATLAERSVFECPDQAPGTYREQGAFGGFTSTYGYNAYALAPASSGYSDLATRPWTSLHQVERPSELFAFGDTLLALYSGQASNAALLDPPRLFQRRRGNWVDNYAPTTAFRHGRGESGFGEAVAARADGSVHTQRPHPEAISNERYGIGSASDRNDPHYVPDWRRW